MPDPQLDPAAPVALVDHDRPASEANADAPELEALVEADLLIEDVSIDGMCGVY